MIKAFYQDNLVTQYHGHSPNILKELPAESVHMAVTSPPYFGLRSYGIEPQVWDDFGIACPDCLGSGYEGGKGREQCPSCNGEGRYRCEHEWGDALQGKAETKHSEAVHKEGYKDAFRNSDKYVDHKLDNYPSQGQFCQKCNAWKGDLGNEPSIDLYLSHLVQIFREIKRVLRKDGTVWLNISDTYSGSGESAGHTPETKNLGRKTFEYGAYPSMAMKKQQDLPAKNLCIIPARVALALQVDGWWVRSDIIWNKPNPMPESVNGWRWERHRIKVKPSARAKKGSAHDVSQNGVNNPQGARNGVNFADHSNEYQDCPGCPKCTPNDGLVLMKGSWRPTRAHEYVFLLTKSDRYFGDADAVKEESIYPDDNRKVRSKIDQKRMPTNSIAGIRPGSSTYPTRNLRSVWTIATEPTPEAHFATFPAKLCEIAIKAGSSERGCCPECLSPWVRVVEKIDTGKRQKMTDGWDTGPGGHNTIHREGREKGEPDKAVMKSKTIGWKPSCECRKHPDFSKYGDYCFENEPIPCTVLDPFSGSGRTLIVAKKLGRKAIGIDLKLDYLKMPLKKLAQERLI